MTAIETWRRWYVRICTLLILQRKPSQSAASTPRVPAIRGRYRWERKLSFKGVPCPNLGTGSFNHHSLTEVAIIDHMEQCCRAILKIIEKYADFKGEKQN